MRHRELGVGYRADIDGLRAISILLVVAFHGGVPWFAGGYIGVDVFFVISGFLITGLLVDEAERIGRISIRFFYTRRIRRLLPMSALVLVTTVLLGLWLLPPTRRVEFVADARSAALYVSNWRFGGQATAYSDVDVTEGLLVHYWSLSIEEQFYLCWPALVAICAAVVRRVGGWSIRAVLGPVVGLLIVGSATASVLVTHRIGSEAYFLTWLRIWELGIGAGLAVAIPWIPRMSTSARGFIAFAGIVAIVGAATTFDTATAFPGKAAALPVLGTAAVLATGVTGSGIVNRFLGTAPLPMIGRLSYAWYLWHWPAIGIAILLDRRWTGGSNSTWATILAIVASLGLAALSHVLIENPVRLSPRLRREAWPTFVMGAGLTLLPLVVGLALITRADVGDTPVLITPDQRPEPSASTNGPDDVAGEASRATIASVPPVPDVSEELVELGELAASPVPDVSEELVELGELAASPVPDVSEELVELGELAASPVPDVSEELDKSQAPVVVGMSPRQAAADKVTITDGCHHSWFGVDADPTCIFGDPAGDTNVVLVGDSHALQWLPAFEALGQTEGWAVRLWTKSTCPILDAVVYNRVLERRYTECEQWRRSVMDAIASIRDVNLVVLARSQGYYKFVLDEADGILSPAAAEPVWSAAAWRTFDALDDLANHTVLLVDTAWPGFNVPDCLAEHSSDPEACAFGRETGRRDGILLEYEQGAAEAKGVAIIDPVPLVCPDDPCRAVTPEGVITYRDSHHLTATYARSLAVGLGELLDAVTETRSITR